jgi:hypothetical protein
MNQLVGKSIGWLASLLLVTTATVVWGIASLVVWISGNASGTVRLAR